MQTNISVITQDKGFRRYVVNMTAEHGGMVVDENMANGSGYGSIDAPVVHAIKPGAAVVVIGASPSAIIEVLMGDSGTPAACMGLCQYYPSSREVSVGVVGEHKATYRILSANIVEGGIELKVEGDRLSYAVLTGSPAGGPFSVENEYLYVSIGDYSEQMVYLKDVGVLDANGDRYVYNPDHWMEETETIGEVTYGIYTKCSGDIVADAMDRCINAMFDQPVVSVVHANGRFVITSLMATIRTMSILDDYKSIASVLGLRDAVLTPSIDITGMEVYASGISRRPFIDAHGDTLLVSPDNVDIGNIGATLYVVDPVKQVTVEVMSA